MEHVPGLLANVAPQVDGVVAIDDGSSDGTAELLASRPEVVELIRRPADRPQWDEVANHRLLVDAAVRRGAEWAICIDGDERLEREFRERAERVIHRGSRLGFSAYRVRFFELWETPAEYRVDGIWGRKSAARLFRVRSDHAFDARPLHANKAPLQARRLGRRLPLADLNLYHLGMLRRDDRLDRRRRYELADPDARWQPRVGYDYLTDERGLRLRAVPPARAFVDSPEVPAASAPTA